MGELLEEDGIPIQKLLETLAKQVFRLVAVSWLLAWLLSKCSSHALLNFPVALALIGLLRWVALHLDVRVRDNTFSQIPSYTSKLTSRSSRAHIPRSFIRRSFAPHLAVDHDAWRTMVNSKLVEFAWEKLCNSIVQEWIYDAWYSILTADKEFPAELRLVLNHCFGELCRRARRVDLRQLLVRHVSEVVKTHLELYRRTVYESLGDSFQNIPTPAGKERALLNDLRTNPKDLHIALQTEDGQYKVLKQYSEGIVSKLLPADMQVPLIQTLIREVVATCALRPVMYYFLPYSLNKLFLSMYEMEATPPSQPSSDGSKDFESRAQASAEQERLHFQQRAERSERRRRQRAASVKPRSESVDRGSKDKPQLVVDSVSRSMASSIDDTSKPSLAVSSAAPSAHTTDWLDLHTTPLPPAHVLHTHQLDMTHAHSDSEIVMETEVAPTPGDNLSTLLMTPTPRKPHHHRSASTGTPLTTPRPSPFSLALTDEANAQPSISSHSGLPQPDVVTNLAEAGADVCLGHTWPMSTAKGLHGKNAAVEVTSGVGGKMGFDGWPRAKVVTAMPRQDPTGKQDFVVYQIRVVDDSGEWTVDRRFRNFEAIHRKLRENQKLRDQVAAKLPSKRMFMSNGQNTEFVEKRRAELDNYLTSLLSEWTVAVCEDVWEFLRQGSEVYGQDLGEGGLIKAFTSNMDLATKSMKKAVGDVLDEGRGRFSKLSSRVGDSATKVASVMPKGMLRLTNSPTKARSMATSFDPSNSAFDMSFGSASSLRMIEDGNRVGLEGSRPVLEAHSSSSTASSPTHKQQAQIVSSAAASPVAAAPNVSADGPPPPPAVPATSPPLARTKSTKPKSSKTPGTYPSGTTTIGKRSSPHKRDNTTEQASLPPRDQDLENCASLEVADSSGISAPLYDVIDTLFDMQSRGFLRRQVIVSARQLLSLVAGDYIDTFLMTHLNRLRSEHTIYRLILQLQKELWPGGIWFATTQTTPPPPATQTGSVAGESTTEPQRPVIQAMQPEKFVDVNYRYGDEDEVAAAVKAKFLSTAPPTLVRLIGPKAYQKSTMDLYNMLQSPTFTLMIGYRIMEGFIVAMFPELEDLVYPYEATT